MLDNPIVIIFAALLVAFVIFSRAFFLWYFKINEHLVLMREQARLLAKLTGEPAESPTVSGPASRPSSRPQ
jgi:hypothetical protein